MSQKVIDWITQIAIDNQIQKLNEQINELNNQRVGLQNQRLFGAIPVGTLLQESPTIKFSFTVEYDNDDESFSISASNSPVRQLISSIQAEVTDWFNFHPHTVSLKGEVYMHYSNIIIRPLSVITKETTEEEFEIETSPVQQVSRTVIITTERLLVDYV